MTESKSKYQVSLCRKTTCCPQLIIENGQYIITDDFGGKVILEQQHIKELVARCLEKWLGESSETIQHKLTINTSAREDEDPDDILVKVINFERGIVAVSRALKQQSYAL